MGTLRGSNRALDRQTGPPHRSPPGNTQVGGVKAKVGPVPKRPAHLGSCGSPGSRPPLFVFGVSRDVLLKIISCLSTYISQPLLFKKTARGVIQSCQPSTLTSAMGVFSMTFWCTHQLVLFKRHRWGTAWRTPPAACSVRNLRHDAVMYVP